MSPKKVVIPVWHACVIELDDISVWIRSIVSLVAWPIVNRTYSPRSPEVAMTTTYHRD